MILKRPWLLTAIALALLPMSAAACSSGPDAKALAKQSCADWGHSDGTIGRTVASLNSSARLAAKAAAQDPRWTPLVTAWQEEASYFRDIGHAVGMGTTDKFKKWTFEQLHRAYVATHGTTETAGTKAGRVIETQCAIARS